MREKPINFSIKHPLPKNVSFCHKPSHPPSPIFQQQNNSSSILHKFTKWVSGQVGKISAHRDPDSPNGKFKPVATYRLTHLLCVSSVCSQPVPNTETLSHPIIYDDQTGLSTFWPEEISPEGRPKGQLEWKSITDCNLYVLYIICTLNVR